MPQSENICILFDAANEREADRLVAVLAHIKVSAKKRHYVVGGGLPRNIEADAVIACFSPAAPPTNEFWQRIEEDEDTPPLLIVQVLGAGTTSETAKLKSFGAVELYDNENRPAREGWEELLIYLGEFFERPGLGVLLPELTNNATADFAFWLEQYDGDPIALDVTSSGGAPVSALEKFRAELLRLISAKPSSKKRIFPLALVAAAAVGITASAAFLLPSSEFTPEVEGQQQAASLPETNVFDIQHLVAVVKMPVAPANNEASQPTSTVGSNFAQLAETLPDGEFRDAVSSGGQSPLMVTLPAGSFEMGSDRQETGYDKNELPKNRVEIPVPFAIAKFEVTEAEFQVYLSDAGITSDRNCEVYQDYTWVVKSSAEYLKTTSYADDMPANCVSWREATNYAEWLGSKTGFTYRLPTEEEWEYAARAGTNTAYSFGNSYEQGCAFMNGVDVAAKEAQPELIGAFCNDGFAELAPRGSLEPNAFGLHDMHGNVWEWTADIWTSSHAEDAWTSDARVMKGGSWFSYPLWLRSANRNSLEPERRRMDVGFRVARDMTSDEPS